MFHVKHHGERAADVVVVGGGHAGCEAAHASARLGADTVLVTHRFDRIGEMSCNPAMGGLGKGHLMREIDALDGVMARVADHAGLQFRLLNRSRGPAVRGPRAQCDRDVYRSAMQDEMANAPSLRIVEGEVVDLLIQEGRVVGVELSDGRELAAKAVVLTTGTFLGGVMHIGGEKRVGGRVGDASSERLAQRIRGRGFRVSRLKTGTPARLRGESIDYKRLEEQPGDQTPEPFSFLTESISQPQICCWITETNDRTHTIIRENLHRSAMYSGHIEGRGPRYCPSIEDKVVRFADKTAHNVFLEPETRDGALIYPNGVSTSLPAEAQRAFLRTIRGLERVEIARPGYAIEYDFVDPTELWASLETRRLPGLYLAGQINGTTGYEEAGALGLWAGLNAARAASGDGAVELSRSEAYLGVLIDDLITRGVSEPYRMFTSRAEFRLSLRADNADERLTAKGVDWGLVGYKRDQAHKRELTETEALRSRLESLTIDANAQAALGVSVNQDGVKRTGLSILAYPGVDIQRLAQLEPTLAQEPHRRRTRVEAREIYAGYLSRQDREVALLLDETGRRIPRGLDYAVLPSLSSELRDKLDRIRPENISQARRIEGMTPAALAIIASAAQTTSDGSVGGE